jgi:hypothetical protein
METSASEETAMDTPSRRTADCPTITIGWRGKGVLARKAPSGVMVVIRNYELCRKGKFFWYFAWLRALYLTGRNR